MKISIALLAALVTLGVASPIEELQQSCGGRGAEYAGDDNRSCCSGYRCIKVSSHLVTIWRPNASGTLTRSLTIAVAPW
jgi:hypothetical protein